MARRGAQPKGKSSFDDTEQVTAKDILGPNCKVRALGHSAGAYYFSDPVGQLRVYDERKMSPAGMISLFLGDISWLEAACPTGSKRDVKGTDRCSWHNPTAQKILITACRRAGFFDPAKQTRGPGIWPLGEITKGAANFQGAAQIVIHAGDKVGTVMFTKIADSDRVAASIDWEDAGCKIGSFVYSARAPRPQPAETPGTEEDAAEAFAQFLRWRLQHGETAAMLALGAVGVGLMPALLPIRPTAFIRGPSGCGKSALLYYMNALMMNTGVVSSNPTWAFFRDRFKETGEACCMMVNEAEVQEDNSRLTSLVEMATFVYGRGEGGYGRSGSGEVQVEGSFVFAAVEPPPVRAQDANRMAILWLDKLQVTAEQAEAFEEEIAETGARLGPLIAARAIAHWPRFRAIFNSFRKGLIDHGHTIRGANTLGTLLAMAHIIRFDSDPVSDDIDARCAELDAKLLNSRDDVRTTEGSCLLRLNTFSVSPFKGGETKPMGEYIRQALYAKDPTTALGVLRRFGVSVVRRKDANGKQVRWVAISNKHDGLELVFRGTNWAKGSWVGAIRMLEGAVVPKSGVWFAGSQDRATLVPVKHFPDAPIEILSDREEDLDDVDAREQARAEAGDVA